jgi:hypothetical protein
MSDDPLAESLRAEAVNSAAIHEEAQAKARSADMHAVITTALQEVLTQGDEGTKRLLIQKIPLLCTDVMTIKGDIRDVKNDIKWIKYFGTAILIGIGYLALKSLGVNI